MVKILEQFDPVAHENNLKNQNFFEKKIFIVLILQGDVIFLFIQKVQGVHTLKLKDSVFEKPTHY